MFCLSLSVLPFQANYPLKMSLASSLHLYFQENTVLYYQIQISSRYSLYILFSFS
nr:MAG TPA: hypothetical protein [Caudoviricetes sp.]